MKWYVIFVETGYEEAFCNYINKVKSHLCSEINYRLLIPKRIIYERKNGVQQEVTKILFPGYVLINTQYDVDFFLKVKKSPHVIRFLKQDDYFLSVNEEEINQILTLVDANGIIELSKAFIEKDKIIIIDGPLVGMEGIIRKIDKRKGRAKVSFSISEHKLLIDLGIEIIKKI